MKKINPSTSRAKKIAQLRVELLLISGIENYPGLPLNVLYDAGMESRRLHGSLKKTTEKVLSPPVG